ncbi:MAG TPA: hypothetical protein VNE62_13270 [Actinomycetota bacterium]|nr:hypothetical protein [Actinomycetota bacterium]
MRKIWITVAAAAVAATMSGTPAQAGFGGCNVPGASQDGTAAGDRNGSGALYMSQGTGSATVGEESGRGYIQVDASTSNGITVHGAADKTTGATLNGQANINPNNTSAPVTICLSPAGTTVKLP